MTSDDLPVNCAPDNGADPCPRRRDGRQSVRAPSYWSVQNVEPGAPCVTPGCPVQTAFGGPSPCWGSWTRLRKGGLRTEQRRARSLRRRQQLISRTGPSRRPMGVQAMAEGLTPWLFWQGLDRLDYSLTLGEVGSRRYRPTSGGSHLGSGWKERFPRSSREETRVAISHRMDRPPSR
jgi:hypothetical protein